MKIISDHGWPKASDGSDEGALNAFKNERDYINQSGKMKTTVAAMDWAAREIERLRTAVPAQRAPGWIDQNHQIDRYGVALMMIGLGCADPAELATRVLSEFGVSPPSTHYGTLQNAAQRLSDELLAQHISRDKFSIGVGFAELHAYVQLARVNCRADVIDGWPVVWHFNVGSAVALSSPNRGATE